MFLNILILYYVIYFVNMFKTHNVKRIFKQNINLLQVFKRNKVVKRSRDSLDLSFNDYRTAFKSKTTWELFRAAIVYQLCSSNYLVENNAKLIKKSQKIFGPALFAKIMKATFYGHFVAGEDEKKIQPVLSRLSSFGVHSILDYSVEEDISQEEAQKREMDALISESAPLENASPKYSHHKKFSDRRYKVNAARTYFYMNEATCEKNMETFIRCLEASSRDGKGFVAIKMTALGRPQLLLQISDVIVKTREFVWQLIGKPGNILQHNLSKEEMLKRLNKLGVPPERSKPFLNKATGDEAGLIHIFPWSGIINADLDLSSTFFIPDVATGKPVRLISKLTASEEETFRNMIRRVSTVIQAASELNVSVMVDAEQTYFQPAISRIAMELMRKFNTRRAIVLNTYQCYLKDTLDELSTDIQQAERQNFYFGAKLVRGAYLEQERARAKELNYSDPTNPNFDATTKMYNDCLQACMERMRKLKEYDGDVKQMTLMVASHNEDTVRFAIEEMLKVGVRPEDGVVSFGQLYGMCDYITFPLGQSGFSVYKYIPYGPVNEVLPYLSRRAHENKGVLKKIKKEKSLLRKEILRRVILLQMFKKPVGFYKPV